MALQVQTFAGTGDEGYVDGPDYSAQFTAPTGMCVDADGAVYVADQHWIRKIYNGVVTTIKYYGIADYVAICISPDKSTIWALDGGSGGSKILNVTTDTLVNFSVNPLHTPTAIASDGTYLYVTNFGTGTIIKVNPTGTPSSSVIRTGVVSPTCISYVGTSTLAYNDGYSVKICSTTGTGVTLIAGSVAVFGWVDANGASARFNGITGLVSDGVNFWVADADNFRIRKIDSTNNVTTYAGNGSVGYVNGPALSASFAGIAGIAKYGAVFYVSDSNRIRIIDNGGAGAEVFPGIGFFLTPVYK